MDIQQFRHDLDAIDWGELEGAYGPSNGSNRAHTDVPGALTFLAELDPDWNPKNAVTLERRDEAIDVLMSHTLHQGSLYEVTPRTLPFVLRLVDHHCRTGMADLVAEPAIEDDLAIYPAEVAQSAFQYARHEGPEDRRLAEQIDAVLADEADRILGWFDGDLRAVATFTCLYGAPLRERGYEQLRQWDHVPYYANMAMAEVGDPPDWALERAEATLEAPAQKDRLAAAALIACAGDVPDRLKPRLDEILRPGAHMILRRDLALPILLDIPEVHPEFDGELVEASVLVSRPDRLIVQAPDVGNVSTHWGAPDIDRGDTVRIGLSPHDEVRVVEWTTADGETKRAELDDA